MEARSLLFATEFLPFNASQLSNPAGVSQKHFLYSEFAPYKLLCKLSNLYSIESEIGLGGEAKITKSVK